MSSYQRDIQELIDRRQSVLDGKLNCLPLGFPRLRKLFPGIEKRRYGIVTANQKVNFL